MIIIVRTLYNAHKNKAALWLSYMFLLAYTLMIIVYEATQSRHNRQTGHGSNDLENIGFAVAACVVPFMSALGLLVCKVGPKLRLAGHVIYTLSILFGGLAIIPTVMERHKYWPITVCISLLGTVHGVLIGVALSFRKRSLEKYFVPFVTATVRIGDIMSP